MKTITIELADDQADRLVEEAGRRNISVEELARAGVMAMLERRAEPFEQALEHVLTKNQELYRRLA